MIYDQVKQSDNTTLPDKINVIAKFKVNTPIAIEHCVKLWT